MSREALERLAGTYVMEGGGFKLLLEVTEEGLLGTFGENEISRMVPLTPLRFKIDGEPPGRYWDFVEEGGEIRALEMVHGGNAQVRLTRQ